MGKIGESLKAGLTGGLVGMSKTPGFMDVVGSISPLAGLASGRGAFGTFTRKKTKEEEDAEDKVVKPTKGGTVNMRKGGKLKDLTGDGKITRADVLKGRGVKGFAKGGSVSKRADGCAQRGKTKGKMV
jgi:hypothetical protein